MRVVITGAGTINPLGADVASTLRAMSAGQSAVTTLAIRDQSRLSVQIGAPVIGFDPAEHFPSERLRFLDRFSQFAVVAARQAILQSGLELSDNLKALAGVIVGTAGGGLSTSDDNFRAVYEERKSRVHPFTVPRLMGNAAASQITIEFGLGGPTFAIASACASSNHAIGLAFQMVRSGLAPVMLAGGAEAMLTFGGLKAWEGLRVLAPDACRPFSLDRSGMVLGEGAAVFVLEARDHAVGRGATILAEVAGFAMSADGADMVLPSAVGAERTMRAALADAALSPEAIGYINAHGTGTRANDLAESTAISAIFGADVAVSSTKGAHGHLIGAAGAVELLACLLALNDGVLAPTAGWRLRDPACHIDVVTGGARRTCVTSCLSNAFAFGGLNAVLALNKPDK